MFDEERKKKKHESLEREQWKGFTVRDFMALKDLMNLLDENEDHLGGSAEEGPPTCSGVSPRAVPPNEIPKFRKKSTNFPPLKTNPNIWTFFTAGHNRCEETGL